MTGRPVAALTESVARQIVREHNGNRDRIAVALAEEVIARGGWKASTCQPLLRAFELAAPSPASPAETREGREVLADAVVNEQIHDWIDKAVTVQDAAYGPFSRDVAGVRLAVAVMEDGVAETRDAWRSERRHQDGQSVRWAMTREEALQVVAIGFRLIRATTDDPDAANTPTAAASPAVSLPGEAEKPSRVVMLTPTGDRVVVLRGPDEDGLCGVEHLDRSGTSIQAFSSLRVAPSLPGEQPGGQTR